MSLTPVVGETSDTFSEVYSTDNDKYINLSTAAITNRKACLTATLSEYSKFVHVEIRTVTSFMFSMLCYCIHANIILNSH